MIKNKPHWDLAQDYYIWLKKITIYELAFIFTFSVWFINYLASIFNIALFLFISGFSI